MDPDLDLSSERLIHKAEASEWQQGQQMNEEKNVYKQICPTEWDIGQRCLIS